jgi:xanthine dehydrogenase small subunit
MEENIQKLAISFFLNGAEAKAEIYPDATVLNLLREQFGLTGTKEGCAEGDCGACTVAIGEIENGKPVYRAYNSCLMPAARLHGRHVVTIEGLAAGELLHPIQQGILDFHGTQCGFCTPGVIMSLFCLFASKPEPNSDEIHTALEGNLCRCTGYRSIRQAALAVSEQNRSGPRGGANKMLPGYFSAVTEKLKTFDATVALIAEQKPAEKNCLAYHRPGTLAELFDILTGIGDCAGYRLIAGGTDVMVDVNVKGASYKNLVDLSTVGGLRFIEDHGNCVAIGANATLNDIIASPLITAKVPLLRQTASKMASEQIRNSATLAGNMANASPIGDGATALLALGATLVLRDKSGQRKMPIESFYLGYKKTGLCSHEIIEAIEVPAGGARCEFIKTAKRSAVDIASVSSALVIGLEGGIVKTARLAFGGVAPTPVLAPKAAQFLCGRALDEGTIKRAADLAVTETSPIGDVRGGREFRKQLVRNHVIRHLAALA